MRIDVAVIGGTGIGSRLAALPGTPVVVPTSAGILRGRLVELGGGAAFAVQRHSAGHATPPHLVNYVANVCGLRALGVRRCIATAAVGCLRKEWPIGALFACTDFIDLSARNLTLFERKVVHSPMDSPFGGANPLLPGVLRSQGHAVPDRVVYLQANGPRYETVAEIAAYSALGADVVGMTAASEAALMREAGIAYECLAVVTNQAAGLGAEIDHGAVGDVMGTAAEAVFAILSAAATVAHEGAARGG